MRSGMGRKRVQVAVALLVAGLGLSACGSGDTSDAGAGSEAPAAASSASSSSEANSSSSAPGERDFSNYKFAYAHAADAGVIAEVGRSISSAAETLGIDLKTFQNDGDGPTAMSNARLMLQEQPDVLIEYNLVEGVGEALGKVLSESDAPCISVNVAVPGCPLINLSNKEAGIGAGEIVAAEAQKRGWTAEDTTVLVVQCSACGEDINNSPRWFYLTVADKLGMTKLEPTDITAETTIAGNNLYQIDDSTLSVEKSFAAARTALQSIPEDRNLLVFGVNDEMSLGVWRAIEAAGRGDRTLVAGLGGTAAGLEQLRTNPQWVAEGTAFLPNWGQYVMAMAVAVAEGAVPPELTKFPQVIMDKQTVEIYYPNGSTDAKVLPPLPPENQYLAQTGVLQAFNNVQGLE